LDLTLPFAGARVIAHVGTQIVADTTRALTLRETTYPPVHYIPIDDVDQSLLATSENHTYCPYKGEASYYTITLPDDTLATPPDPRSPQGRIYPLVGCQKSAWPVSCSDGPGPAVGHHDRRPSVCSISSSSGSAAG
jgi:hypothetical protein